MTKRLALAALAVLLVLQAIAIVRGADRHPHVDEVEYLHAAWLMSEGEEVFTSFFEHHPPFLFAAFRPLVTDDVPAFFVRVRLLSGLFGLVAVAAFAAMVWRVRPEVTPIAVALLFASGSIWINGLTAARAEPFALAFFWCGAALVLLARDDLAKGAGLALVAVAALWTPKWPFCSLVVAVFWFFGTRRKVPSAAVAVGITAAAVVLLHLISPLDRVWFFCVEYNRALWPWLSRSRELLVRELRGGEAFLFAPSLLHPLLLVVPLVVVAVLLRRNRIVLFFLLLAAASMLELRFTFPWPVIWSYYYLMWGFAAAAIVSFVPVAIERFRRLAQLYAAVVLLVAGAYIAVDLDTAAPPPSVSLRYLQSRLRPDETVLLELTRHPVAARDAAYYWFGYGYILPVADELRQTERGRRYLPPTDQTVFCGDVRSLRFAAPPRLLRASPREQQCFEGLNPKRTPFADVFEVAPETRSR